MNATTLYNAHPSTLTYADLDTMRQSLTGLTKAELDAIRRTLGLVGRVRTKRAAVESIDRRVRGRLDAWKRTSF